MQPNEASSTKDMVLKSSLKCAIPSVLFAALLIFCFLWQEQAYEFFKPLINIAYIIYDLIDSFYSFLLNTVADSPAQIFVYKYLNSCGWILTVLTILAVSCTLWSVCALNQQKFNGGVGQSIIVPAKFYQYIIWCWLIMSLIDSVIGVLLVVPGNKYTVTWLVWAEISNIALLIVSSYVAIKFKLNPKWVK
jgi:hypothetical protein